MKWHKYPDEEPPIGSFLATRHYDNYGTPIDWITILVRDTSINYYFLESYDNRTLVDPKGVTAWMELPEPYKTDSNEQMA